MSKFSGPNTTTKTIRGSGPTGTKGRALTHEGFSGFEKDEKTALYTLACTDMVNESKFYESGSERHARFVTLVKHVTAADPAWVAAFVPFLRNEANMRSASIVLAAEYAKALTDLRANDVEIDAPNIRGVIASACSRADEPAEMLGYWLATYGRKIPMGVKRGIADAATRLYNEYGAIKYDGGTRGVRPSDVLDLTHPTPLAAWQSLLFKHLIDRRHNHFEGFTPEERELLPKVAAMYDIDATPEGERRALLSDPQRLADAGYTWERLSGWIPGGMDAGAWEGIIPSMGYMALLRNLRNFEQAKVSKPVLKGVAEMLGDPERVAKSRQFPFRFWSAYKHSGSILFGPALEEALDLSCQNIPEFEGRTLVAVDTSASMGSPISSNSVINCVEVAGLFGSAVANRCGAENVKLIQYADSWAEVPVSTSVLRTAETLHNCIGDVGHGTQTWPSVVSAFEQFGGFDRIVVFSDMQDHPALVEDHGGEGFANVRGRYSYGRRTPVKLPDVPIYMWDLGGYGTSNIENRPGRYMFSGFSDSAFRLIPLVEIGLDAGWPWEQD